MSYLKPYIKGKNIDGQIDEIMMTMKAIVLKWIVIKMKPTLIK